MKKAKGTSTKQESSTVKQAKLLERTSEFKVGLRGGG